MILVINIKNIGSETKRSFGGLLMYVCLCFGVRKKIIEEILASHSNLKVRDVQKICKAGQGCGTCMEELKSIVTSYHQSSENSVEKTMGANCKISP